MTSQRTEQLRASLWALPAAIASGSLVLTLLLLGVRPEPQRGLGELAWPGGPESATAFLQLVATAVMTATTVTISLTIVALQLASQHPCPCSRSR